MRADLSHPDLNEEKQGTGNKHTSARVMLAQPTATPVILEVQYTVSQNLVERLSANAANGSYISLFVLRSLRFRQWTSDFSNIPLMDSDLMDYKILSACQRVWD